jgi:3-isopropylmalate/(R)-2-methylmalate dehydratase small subunit
MRAFRKITGAAVPLMLANVDTDVIIRIERLTGGADLGRYALEALRYLPDGGLDLDCILNAPHYRDAPILLAGRNFGCGSSREGAVAALMQMGVRSVVAPSFGDIFYANCFQNGLLPVVLPEEETIRLAAVANTGDVTVDLERRVVVSPDGRELPFETDALQREAMLEGLDELGLTLKCIGEIEDWQRSDRRRRPWMWPDAEGGRR